MRSAVFSPAALAMLLICAVVLFALSVLLPAFDDRPVTTGNASGPGTFSTSALGHAGFYDVLQRLGRPVRRSVLDGPATAGEKGTLIQAEPDMGLMADNQRFLFKTPRLLLVLPKWRGAGRGERPHWIGRATLRPIGREPQWCLDMFTEQSRVIRRRWPAKFTVNEMPFTPSGSGRIQLIRSETMRPVVAAGDGILVGEITLDGRRVWVLSDPDIMSNHGLGLGQNAAFMVALTDALAASDGGGGPLVFDETVHGFQPPEWSPLKLLFRMPFAVVTILALTGALMMLWAGLGRFGAARPAPRPLDFGKAGLIANGARLLEYAGHQRVTLGSYIKMILYSSALALHAPGGLSDQGLIAWLDRLGRARKVESSCAEILREASETHGAGGLNRLYNCARRMYTWKGEILHGSGTGRINRQ